MGKGSQPRQGIVQKVTSHEFDFLPKHSSVVVWRWREQKKRLPEKTLVSANLTTSTIADGSKGLCIHMISEAPWIYTLIPVAAAIVGATVAAFHRPGPIVASASSQRNFWWRLTKHLTALGSRHSSSSAFCCCSLSRTPSDDRKGQQLCRHDTRSPFHPPLEI